MIPNLCQAAAYEGMNSSLSPRPTSGLGCPRRRTTTLRQLNGYFGSSPQSAVLGLWTSTTIVMESEAERPALPHHRANAFHRPEPAGATAQSRVCVRVESLRAPANRRRSRTAGEVVASTRANPMQVVHRCCLRRTSNQGRPRSRKTAGILICPACSARPKDCWDPQHPSQTR